MVNVAEPGYTTTEFWGKLFVQAIGLLILFHVIVLGNDQLQGILSFGSLVIPEIFYAISRGIRKRDTTNAVVQGTKLVTAATADATPPK